MSKLYRFLPSMVICLAEVEKNFQDFKYLPRPLLRELINGFLDRKRELIAAGVLSDPADLALPAILPDMLTHVRNGLRPSLRRVINAAGVVVHTNMGRSVLAEEAAAAAMLAAANYSNLELDLATGERGSRYSHISDLICAVTGAESAIAVNNNAAAVLLALDSVCRGGEVIVSRGELVEIGGSFRIPEVMAKSGAVLREVGATNRTHVYDYENAINENTRALMRVHTSNYRIIGFHSVPSLVELSALGRKHGVPVIEDLGSGCLIDLSPFGLPGEPTVRSVVEGGAALVTFSGDKVLGGPQAGIIAGKREYIDKIRANHLLRALRLDKLTLAALEATLRLYLDPELARRKVPTLAMLTASKEELAVRAGRLARRLRAKLGKGAAVSVADGVSRVGGGAFPERDLPTALVRVRPRSCSAEALKAALLKADPPILARIEDDALCLDPRTLNDADFSLLAAAIAFHVTHGAPNQES